MNQKIMSSNPAPWVFFLVPIFPFTFDITDLILEAHYMFGDMHFIYCTYKSIASNVDSTYLGYLPTEHNVYFFGERPARTSDIEITSPTLTRQRHKSNVFFR